LGGRFFSNTGKSLRAFLSLSLSLTLMLGGVWDFFPNKILWGPGRIFRPNFFNKGLVVILGSRNGPSPREN